LWKWLYYWKKSTDQCNFHENSKVSFQRNRKTNRKILWETQKTLNSQRNPKQKEQGGIITLLDLKFYYSATILETTKHCQ
jgi:hypothetical protein